MTAPVLPPTAPLLERRGQLSRGNFAALGGAAVAFTVALLAGTGAHGAVQGVLILDLLILALVPGASAIVEGTRRAKDRLVTTLVYSAFLLALAPLVSVLSYTVSQGVGRFDTDFFTHSLRNIGARDAGGGAYHAIVGTLEQVGLASLISIPFGILVAIYIVEYGGRGRLAGWIRFFVDVMTGIPSVVAGLFVLAFYILGLGFGASGIAAAFALTILMLPTIIRSSEEMLKLVPGSLREASLALGVPQWKTILKIVLPTALPGIVTGVMLAIARAMGETAPILLTAFGSASINNDPFNGPQESLPLFIYKQAGDAQQTAVDRAWTAALTLILVVMALNLLARLVTRRSTLKKG